MTSQHTIEWVDIETVIRPEHRGLIDEITARAVVPEPDRASVVPPANLKDPAKIEAAIDKKFLDLVADHPAAIAKAEAEAKRAIRKLATDPLYSKVIAIAHGQDDGEIEVIHGDDEERVISEYAAAVEARCVDDSEASARFVRAPLIGGHNTKFDVRFLFKRAVMIGARLPRFWPFDVANDWDRRLLDTGQIWSPGAFASLDDTCLQTGGLGKDGVDGSMVDALHQAGDWEAIVRYAKGDLQDRTRPAYHRMIAAMGMGPLVGSVKHPVAAGGLAGMSREPLDDVIPDFMEVA